MTRKVPFKRISRTEAKQFAAKGEEFLEAAREAFALKLYTAAASNAVHSGINAADAITGFRLGRRSSGQSHEQALVLLRDVAEGKEAGRALAPLIKLKPRAEYDPAPITRTIGERALRHAERIMEIARAVAATSER